MLIKLRHRWPYLNNYTYLVHKSCFRGFIFYGINTSGANWCKVGIYLVLNQKKSKKYLVQNQNILSQLPKIWCHFGAETKLIWCRIGYNYRNHLVQQIIVLVQEKNQVGAKKNNFGAKTGGTFLVLKRDVLVLKQIST